MVGSVLRETNLTFSEGPGLWVTPKEFGPGEGDDVVFLGKDGISTVRLIRRPWEVVSVHRDGDVTYQLIGRETRFYHFRCEQASTLPRTRTS